MELLSSEEVPSPKPKIMAGTRARNQATPTEPSKPRNTYDLGHHLTKMSSTTQALFELLREGIMDLGDDVTERFMNQYIGYRRLKNFCEIGGQRRKLNVFIVGPVEDAEGVGVDMTGIGHWSTGDLRAEVSTEDDIAPVLRLVQEAYPLQQ